MYLDDTLTHEELSDANAAIKDTRGTREPGKRHGSLRDAVDALRPYAASEAQVKAWAADLIAWFSVSAGRVTVWRTGTDEAVIEIR